MRYRKSILRAFLREKLENGPEAFVSYIWYICIEFIQNNFAHIIKVYMQGHATKCYMLRTRNENSDYSVLLFWGKIKGISEIY